MKEQLQTRHFTSLFVTSMVLVLFMSGCVLPTTPTPAPSASLPIFTYFVRIQDKVSLSYLPNTKVVIEVLSSAPLQQFTDENGAAQFIIDSARAGQAGKITIEADGYKPTTLNINLTVFDLPQTIQLEPVDRPTEIGQIGSATVGQPTGIPTRTSTESNPVTPTNSPIQPPPNPTQTANQLAPPTSQPAQPNPPAATSNPLSPSATPRPPSTNTPNPSLPTNTANPPTQTQIPPTNIPLPSNTPFYN